MTHKGTFIVNGSEKVVVSQLVRSSGAYYKKQLNQKLGIYNCFFELIPNRGTWLEFETSFASPYDNPNFDINNSVYVKVDKSKKATLTNLFTVFGISRQDIELLFDKDYLFHNCYRQTGWTDDNHLNFEEAVLDIYKKIKTGESVNPEGGAKYIYSLLFDDRKYDLSKVGRYKFQQKLAIENRVYGYTLAEPVYDDQGEIFLKKGTVLKTKKFQMLKKALQDGYCTSHVKVKKDVGHEGIISKIVIYRKDIHNEDANPITIIGPDPHTTTRQLLVGDILAAVSYWYNLLNHIGVYDDIDHLSNRRVRSVGEILQNQFRIGMFRIEKFSTEQLNNTSDVLGLKPINLINSKLLTSVITEFFNISQLCQFMDQTNPLAELTNKRRITALGPGGLSKEHAMIDVRDVHYSHYSRICPIETPEGPNIGLINNIATFTKINEYGFLVAPYYRVKNKKVSFTKVHYLTANEEYNHIIAQGKMNLTADKTLREHQLIARYQGANILADANDVEYFDVSPNQIVSVAAACIPFLENDDANRALMGANMQRQAVPLLNPATPIVATGMEHVAARDSGLAVVSTQHGKVTYVDATEIIIKGAEETKVYHLDNFMRSNQATLLHHTPLVRVGDKVAPNDIIADGSGIKNGELALGQNVRVAFTT